VRPTRTLRITSGSRLDARQGRLFVAVRLAVRSADVARVVDLANEFHASTRMIENQLANAGAIVSNE
jgi:hypothetical protein